jgi:hypothetical protein
VAASHTSGMRVEVWDTFGPPVSLHEGQATVTALRELGAGRARRPAMGSLTRSPLSSAPKGHQRSPPVRT